MTSHLPVHRFLKQRRRKTPQITAKIESVERLGAFLDVSIRRGDQRLTARLDAELFAASFPSIFPSQSGEKYAFTFNPPDCHLFGADERGKSLLRGE